MSKQSTSSFSDDTRHKSLAAFVVFAIQSSRHSASTHTHSHNGEKHGSRYALCILNKSFCAQSKPNTEKKERKKLDKTLDSHVTYYNRQWNTGQNSDCTQTTNTVFKIELKWKGQFSMSVRLGHARCHFKFVFHFPLNSVPSVEWQNARSKYK